MNHEVVGIQPDDHDYEWVTLRQATRATGYSEKSIPRRYQSRGEGRCREFRVPLTEMLELPQDGGEEFPVDFYGAMVVQMREHVERVRAETRAELMERIATTERDTRIALQEALRARTA